MYNYAVVEYIVMYRDSSKYDGHGWCTFLY